MFQREKFAEHNANAIAARRVPGVDPLAEITHWCIRIVGTFKSDLGGCGICNSVLAFVGKKLQSFPQSQQGVIVKERTLQEANWTSIIYEIPSIFLNHKRKYLNKKIKIKEGWYCNNNDARYLCQWANKFKKMKKMKKKENEWRSIGVQQSRGWVHYAIHCPEPDIMLFRRPLNYQQQQDNQVQQNILAK
ncbi:hypothetical protein Pfo_007306 [Paulownia fortunei]|nr:hypothetical protein Pfo_007306 [Paulownia fortunei]